jgi:hypothetical protein
MTLRFAFFALLFAVPGLAQVPGEQSSFAKTAAPFIDVHTLVVVRVDVSRAEVDSVLKLAAPIFGEGDEGGEAVAGIKQWVKDFIRVGGKDIFLTYGPGDFPNLPCFIAKAPDNERARKAIEEKLLVAYRLFGKDAESANIHNCICVGTRESLAVLEARKAVERPDLAAAIEIGKDGVAQLAFAMSAEAKKIHEQVAPTLPAELGGGRIQTLTRGLKWVALVVGPGPKLPAKLITETTSPQAAHDLRGLERNAQSVALAQLLKSGGETDADFEKRVKELIERNRTTTDGSRITTEWEIATTLLEAIKLPEVAPADRVRSMNNMKQLMLALHNYHDAVGHFPTDIRDKDGNPLLSWRVQILPYIEQDNLYRQFRMNERWDSEHNKKLIAQMPKVFRSPRQADAIKNKTTYLAPLGKGSMWDEPKGLKIFQITDGLSNTIGLVEADDDRAVTWSKPEDITIDPKNPMAGLLGHYTEGFHVALADGSVRFIKKTIDPKTLWHLFTRDGGEVMEIPK